MGLVEGAVTDVRLRIAIQADLRARNGVTVSIDERFIRFTQPGPRGGAGTTIDVRLDDWEAIDAAVKRLRTAIAATKHAAEQAVAGAPGEPAEGETDD